MVLPRAKSTAFASVTPWVAEVQRLERQQRHALVADTSTRTAPPFALRCRTRLMNGI